MSDLEQMQAEIDILKILVKNLNTAVIGLWALNEQIHETDDGKAISCMMLSFTESIQSWGDPLDGKTATFIHASEPCDE